MDENIDYAADAPTREEIDAIAEPLIIEFGAPWCSFCRGAQAVIAAGLASGAPRHLRIEDGKGKPLGRSFAVKLWPTLVFLRQGREIARVVRPTDTRQLEEALAALLAQPARQSLRR